VLENCVWTNFGGMNYSRYMEFNFLLDVKVIYLIDRTDLFKISDLISGGEAIVTDLYSSLKEQRERERWRVKTRRREEIMLITTRK
jgi:hypothetical protein